jgi:hypothetical protein
MTTRRRNRDDIPAIAPAAKVYWNGRAEAR